MLLGKYDRRVPMAQSLNYHRILSAKGVKTRCLIYDDNHDLQKVDVDGDVFINMCPMDSTKSQLNSQEISVKYDIFTGEVFC